MHPVFQVLAALATFGLGLFVARFAARWQEVGSAMKLVEAEAELHRLRDELAVWKSVAVQSRSRIQHQRDIMRHTYYAIVNTGRTSASQDALRAKHREQWPALWEALDELVLDYERPLTQEETTL